ncbi:MAG: SUMF1/EgtB/PvdO family nonheme iron enzyme [Candidatus Cloacimonadaceae bacterium]
MSYYKYSPDFSYQDFLNQKKYIITDGEKVTHAVIEVSKQILDLIADEESLKLNGVTILDSHPGMPSDTDSPQVILAFSVEELTNKINELPAKFRWGLGDCIARLMDMNESFSSLIKQTDTPEQTLAYSHFEKAREAFNVRDCKKAMNEAEKAIYGNRTSSGFQSEWRFYLLLGILHLGFYGCSTEILDLEKAEEEFLHAAMFSQSEFRTDSAIAFMAAGWAAYCQGKIDEAIKHNKEALERNSKLFEAHYLMSKYQLASGKSAEGFEHLTKAIQADAFYALKAAGDDDFKEQQIEYKNFLISLKHTQYEKFQNRINEELKQVKSQVIPPELQAIMDKFNADTPLMQLSKTIAEWNVFKVTPVFVSKLIENLKIEHEAVVQVIEPYHEKVIIRKKSLFRKEESKIVTKTKVIERKKKIRYTIKIFRDAFMFFTGKILVDFDMVEVPGNKFEMGDTAGFGRSDERPIQKVELNSFLVCRTPVTQKLWNLVMDDNPSNFQGFELPVEHISWYDAIEFCNRLSLMADFMPCYIIDQDKTDPTNHNKNDGKKWLVQCNPEADGYRLLTEAEWEFAARGGSNSNYYNYAGSEQVGNVAWIKDNSGFKTHPVGQKKPNEIGLYDMSGNIWEWCWDWYDNYSETELVNPCGAENGQYKIIRGGSWADNKNYQRVASRGKENPSGKYSSIGLRIARNIV